jgi:hypothetical protein
MAPKHDEIVRYQAGGWSIAWDTNVVDPATRKAFDKVVAENTRALREILRSGPDQAVAATRQPARRARTATLRG